MYFRLPSKLDPRPRQLLGSTPGVEREGLAQVRVADEGHRREAGKMRRELARLLDREDVVEVAGQDG